MVTPSKTCSALVAASIATVLAFGSAGAQAQAPAAQAAASTPATARSLAPTDLTGWWVAVVTEDWRMRMTTPPIGEVAGIPVNAEGLKAAQAWQPEKDVAAGEQCRAWGAGGIMRMPVRLHISWQDDSTLRVDIDNGQQTRLFRFGAAGPAPATPDWQGVSRASWETMVEAINQAPSAAAVVGQARNGAGAVGGTAAARPAAPPPRPLLSSALKVVTTQMRPGYLRRNGVPYTGNAVMTEYFDRMNVGGEEWLVLTSSLEEPTYLAVPYLLTNHYRKEPDGARFNPRPCVVTPPTKGPGSAQ
jgi:hypothetical protein